MSRLNHSKRWLLFAAALATFLLGAAGFTFCFAHHICMGGHMQHGPYPSWHYIADAAWVTVWLGTMGLLGILMAANNKAGIVATIILALLLGGYWRFLLSYGSRHGWPIASPRASNHSMQRTEAGRLAQFVFGYQGRLAPAADGQRY